ncbi:hypothetical protein K469DRAFT_681823 [Zopfia rhizophila CBS 207.26]|uniref:Zn(2)-C6 fungal-type domain-containing protein n=1 Tax=Zopfia rhizophila CBS 207.26 TaxID=1314779 RepID=A0A6A6EWD2_9PEZI|nr:hypothetical protein K469DRAFT_681823 [Zopfia rhizophila CBS 207.26]
MEGGDPDAPTQKRPRLDSVNPVYNGLPPPPHPPHQVQPTRHPTAQASSPTPTRHYPPHSLPPPSQSYPPPGHFPGPSPSPSLPPSDIRTLADPRNIPSPGQRAHGAAGPPVTLPARTISQDSISTYSRQPVTPQSSAPDPQTSRSTSGEAKPPPGMDHGGHQAPWPMNPEHRHNGSMSNGYAVVSPPHEQYQPPPMAPNQHFGQPVNAYPPGPYMGPAQQYQGQAQVRRKQVRATQACNNCRSRKQKCDEQRPCQFCKENNYECQYKDVPPPKQDRTMMQLQESVNNVSEMLKTFVEGFNSWKDSVESRIPASSASEARDNITVGFNHHATPSVVQGHVTRDYQGEQSGSGMPTPMQGRRVADMIKTESPTVQNLNVSPIPAHSATPIKQDTILAPPQPPATPADSVRTDTTQQLGEPARDRTGLLSDHTTPAHQLLEDWPSMQSFCNNIPYFKKLLSTPCKLSDYPMQLERNRGLIRVWGVGEGYDLNDGAQGPGSPDSNNSDAPSPAAREGLWGPRDASSPSTMSIETPRDHPGGLNPDGTLKLDQETVFKLLRSYQENMHTLHPFLDPSRLKVMVNSFVKTYGSDPRTALSPDSAVPSHVHVGIKRKRSTSTFGDLYSPAGDRGSPGPIEKSLRNALVLLVLALGKVCEYKQPLPAPQGDRAFWSSNRGSPHSSNLSLVGDDSDPRPRNIDHMPGMAYFSYATDILGNQQGGNTIAHAQANLLAALYLGQFARVLESWSWISNACRVCLILIKADMVKISRKALFEQQPPPKFPPKEEYRLNLVKCVYWTCLQLESDILAEISTLPPSGISRYQDDIAYPTGVFEHLPDAKGYDDNSEHDRIMYYYSTQIHLRVILNEAHNGLYRSADRRNLSGLDSNNLKEVAKTAKIHADILGSWRNLLPPPHQWEDEDPPATDINVARLRAKYYGGLYMILRPFLFIAVHEIELPPGPPISSALSSHTSSPAAVGEPGATPTMPRSLMDLTSDQESVVDIAFRCINSAIASTVAFDRVGAVPTANYEFCDDIAPRRLIVTNILGTLHAQFGNVLVLAAVYKSRLRPLLPNDRLNRATMRLLFKRTIKVLRQVAPNSPILEMDVQILENVRSILRLDT